MNVSALLGLLVFVYAVLGVHLFTFVRHGANIADDNNFDTLPQAALLLFQCLTGDGWAMFMVDASVSAETGRCSEAAGDCGSRLAVPYFVSFQIIGAFVFLNVQDFERTAAPSLHLLFPPLLTTRPHDHCLGSSSLPS